MILGCLIGGKLHNCAQNHVESNECMQSITESSPCCDWVNKSSAQIRSASTDYDLIKVFKDHVSGTGMKFFAFANFRLGDQTGETVSIGINNWHPVFLSDYRYHRALLQNPVLTRLRSAVLPSVVERKEIIEAETDRECRDFQQSLLKAGLEILIHLPVRSTDGQNGAVVYSGARESLSDSDLMQLSYVAQQGFERATVGAASNSNRQPVLSERERECLILTAQGLNSERVGDALGISTHTVQYHISSICRKLDAVSKIHAVSIAIRDRHIII